MGGPTDTLTQDVYSRWVGRQTHWHKTCISGGNRGGPYSLLRYGDQRSPGRRLRQQRQFCGCGCQFWNRRQATGVHGHGQRVSRAALHPPHVQPALPGSQPLQGVYCSDRYVDMLPFIYPMYSLHCQAPNHSKEFAAVTGMWICCPPPPPPSPPSLTPCTACTARLSTTPRSLLQWQVCRYAAFHLPPPPPSAPMYHLHCQALNHCREFTAVTSMWICCPPFLPPPPPHSTLQGGYCSDRYVDTQRALFYTEGMSTRLQYLAQTCRSTHTHTCTYMLNYLRVKNGEKKNQSFCGDGLFWLYFKKSNTPSQHDKGI